jgi:hypothetical protein
MMSSGSDRLFGGHVMEEPQRIQRLTNGEKGRSKLVSCIEARPAESAKNHILVVGNPTSVRVPTTHQATQLSTRIPESGELDEPTRQEFAESFRREQAHCRT